MLREEFAAIEAHCAKKSVVLWVAVEQLCTRNVDLDRKAISTLEEHYSIPEDNKHRLVLPPGYNASLHHCWLCFSSPSKPSPALGLGGDIWVDTSDGEERVYHHTGIGWSEWSVEERVRHPFAKDLVLAFGVWKLSWFPLSDLKNVFPDLWKAYFDDDRKTLSPPVRTIVRELYDASGKPKRQESANVNAEANTTVVQQARHECCGQVRALKQWPASRTHFVFGRESSAEEDGEDKACPDGVLSQPCQCHMSLLTRPFFTGGFAARYLREELKYHSDVWDNDGTMFVVDYLHLFKLSSPFIGKYSKKLQRSALASNAVGALDGLPVYTLPGETEENDLAVFIRAVRDMYA